MSFPWNAGWLKPNAGRPKPPPGADGEASDEMIRTLSRRARDEAKLKPKLLVKKNGDTSGTSNIHSFFTHYNIDGTPKIYGDHSDDDDDDDSTTEGRYDEAGGELRVGQQGNPFDIPFETLQAGQLAKGRDAWRQTRTGVNLGVGIGRYARELSVSQTEELASVDSDELMDDVLLWLPGTNSPATLTSIHFWAATHCFEFKIMECSHSTS